MHHIIGDLPVTSLFCRTFVSLLKMDLILKLFLQLYIYMLLDFTVDITQSNLYITAHLERVSTSRMRDFIGIVFSFVMQTYGIQCGLHSIVLTLADLLKVIFCKGKFSG